MKIAPDVERLMWMVAESADQNAVEDFESRFPQLRYELAKRIEMVRNLKASGRSIRREGAIPQFRKPAASLPSPFGARMRWSIAALALSALAFGSFFATRALIPPKAPPPVIDNPSFDPTNVSDPVNPDVQTPEEPDTIENSTTTEPMGLKPPDDQPIPDAAWQRPQTVKFQRIGLASALQAIGLQCGLKLDIPDDMPNDEIVVDYRGMTGLEILADMGPRFGFTAFDQGGGQVIIVPTRDDNAPDSNPSDARAHRPLHPTVGKGVDTVEGKGR